MYPSHLKFEFTAFAQSQGIAFLDLLFVFTSPIVHTVFCKPTHSCNYIPFAPNTPTRYKTQYIKGECVCYLRLNNRRVGYELCCKRLQGALKRLKIPSRFWSPMPLQWEDRPKYVEYRNRQRRVVHVFRVPYHSALPMQYSYFTAKMTARIRNFIPDVNLRVVWKPMRNLRPSYQHFHRKTLQAVAQGGSGTRDAQRSPALASKAPSSAEGNHGLSQLLSVMESLDPCSVY